MTITRALAVVGVLTIAGCGGNGGGGAPTGPSGPSGTPASLALTPATDLIRIRASETFTLTATLSNGSSQNVQGSWGSDQAAVATVEGGRVTGVASGQATIFADYQGLRATRLVRVVPNYQGRWEGAFRLTGCTDEGIWRLVETCQDFLTDELYVFSTALTQDRAAVAGTVDLGNFPGPVEGAIQMTGHLQVAGTLTLEDEDVVLHGRLLDWDTVSTDNERMSGRFTLVMEIPGIDGWIRLDCELRLVTKTSPTAATAPAGGSGLDLGSVMRRTSRVIAR